MNVLLTTLNTKYIHKSLALRWLYVSCPKDINCEIKEFTINDKIDSIINKIEINKYDVVGLSVYIWNNKETKELISKLKEIKPNIRIILGGPDVTFENDEWFDLPIEAICLGEGEKAFWDYLKNGYEDSIKTKKYEKKTIARVDLSYLEQFENPYFLEIDQKEMSNRYLYLETSRGCPYGCRYCLSETDRQVRIFSDEYLNKIFDRLNDYHFYQVKFLDRTFNFQPQRALKIMNKLNQIQSVDSFHMELVAETLPEELIEFMMNKMDKKRFRFEVGVQSFNTLTLKEVHRISNIEKLVKVLKRLIESGVIIHTDLIAGLPYEDLESFKNSFDRLFNLHPSELQCGTLKLLKGTSLREKASDYDIIYHKESPYEVVKTKWISEKDLDVIHNVALGIEKSYNNHRLSYTIMNIIDNPEISAFDLFYELGLMIKSLSHPYQLVDYFKQAYVYLEKYIDEDQLKGLLLLDYYKNTYTKPKTLFEYEKDSKVRDFILESKIINEYQLNHYSIMTPVYYHNKRMTQLLVYYDHVRKSEHYIIDIEKRKIEIII